MTERVVVMGAAGRDFHDYLAALRDDPDVEVAAFTRAPGQNLGETDADFEERLAAHADDELDRVRRFIENQYVTKAESVPAFVDREF